MSKRAKLLGLRIECPRQLPTRNIPRENFRLEIIKRKRCWVVLCDCGGVHRIRAQNHDKPPKWLPQPARSRKDGQ